MPSLTLRITLETDIVLSASSATIGAHRSLRRITGRALLGCCAAQGYDSPRAFDLFHSGRVRYGDGLPEAGGIRAMPVPFSLHREKGKPASEPLWNLAVADRPKGKQLDQVREGHVGPDGGLVPLDTHYTMRTAVSEQGRARDGFLFGMESIAAGGVFRATIDADDEDLLREVERRLVGKVHHVGRSRTAEFGKARIERAEEAAWPVAEGAVDRVRIWCVSDLVLRDASTDASTGAPRLRPEGADFLLQEASFDEAHSFIRAGRYSPFNGHRRRPESERQVILAGSVLVFEQPGTDLGALRVRLSRGVGDYRAEGFGQVLVQAGLLDQERPLLREAERAGARNAQRPEDPLPPPNDDLGRWLAVRLAQEEHEAAAWELSREWSRAMERYPVPPAQWGEVRRMAAMARVSRKGKKRFLEDLRARLGFVEQPANGSPSKDRRQARGAAASRWTAKRGGKTAAECLVKLIQDEPADDRAVIATELLAARRVREIRQKADARKEQSAQVSGRKA